MRLSPRLCLLVLMAGSAFGQEGPPAGVEVPAIEKEKVAKPKTVSLSKQFVVHGADLKLRSAVARLAEETKEALDKEVGTGDGWKHTIVIQLRGAEEGQNLQRSLHTSLAPVGDGFRPQLDVFHLERGLNNDEMERAVLKLLLFERTLRGRNSNDVVRIVDPPWWLMEGLLEAFRWRNNEGDKRLYEALFRAKKGVGVAALLEAKGWAEMGAGERAIFRASAGTLVLALLRQEGGKEGMAGVLGDVGVFEGNYDALLKQHFSGLNLGKNSLEKWWALQLAELSKLEATETLTILESEEKLADFLVLRFEDAERGTMEFRPGQFRDLLAIPTDQRIELMRPMSDGLNQFRFEAFPGYRPIVIGYLTVLADLAGDKDAEIDARLASLSHRRAEMVVLGKRVRDLLEWYQINSAQELSGDFETWADLKKQLEMERSENRGPLADYLRDVQAIFGE